MSSAAVSMKSSPPPRPQVLGDMAQHGWDGLLVPLVRFWEGERSRERLLAGVKNRNERDLLEYVYDTYFAPLMDHTPVVLDPLSMADGFVRKHKVRLHCRERRTVESSAAGSGERPELALCRLRLHASFVLQFAPPLCRVAPTMTFA